MNSEQTHGLDRDQHAAARRLANERRLEVVRGRRQRERRSWI
jgi:hypothetical protein